MAFSNPIRYKMMRGIQAHLKSFFVAPFLESELQVEDAAAQLKELNVVGLHMIISSTDWVATLNYQEKVEYSLLMSSTGRPMSTHNGLNHSR